MIIPWAKLGSVDSAFLQGQLVEQVYGSYGFTFTISLWQN